MDELTKSLFRYILSLAPADEAAVQQAVQIALVGRHFERIADHAVTIAERVVFMATGEWTLDDTDRPEVAGETTDALSLRVGSRLLVAEVPVDDEPLALGVAVHPLAVAPELRVVRAAGAGAGRRPADETRR